MTPKYPEMTSYPPFPLSAVWGGTPDRPQMTPYGGVPRNGQYPRMPKSPKRAKTRNMRFGVIWKDVTARFSVLRQNGCFTCFSVFGILGHLGSKNDPFWYPKTPPNRVISQIPPNRDPEIPKSTPEILRSTPRS